MGKEFKIGCDVDGVLANWYLAMCKKFDMPLSEVPKILNNL